jgi:hypothetical protein
MLAVFALGAVTSASALAAETHAEWLFNGAKLGVGVKKTVTKAEGGPYKLEATGLPTVECGKQKIEGTENFIEGISLSKTKLVFSECKIPGSPKCTVPNIKTSELHNVIIHFDSVWIIIYFPWPSTKEKSKFTGEEFATIKIEGAECAVANTLKVTGSVVVEPSANKLKEEVASRTLTSTTKTIETENPSTKVVEKAGELKLGTKEAKLTGVSTVEVESGKKWGAE